MDLLTITYPNSTFVSFVFITSIPSLVVVDQIWNMINLPASISIGINISIKGCVFIWHVCLYLFLKIYYNPLVLVISTNLPGIIIFLLFFWPPLDCVSDRVILALSILLYRLPLLSTTSNNPDITIIISIYVKFRIISILSNFLPPNIITNYQPPSIIELFSHPQYHFHNCKRSCTHHPTPHY